MDRKMMNQWLAAQSQKKQVTEADMQRKRLGIKEAVNYGDINFRVPIDPNTEQTNAPRPRSPESAANLTRRLENLYKAVGDTENVGRQQRIANMMLSKGVAPEGTGKPLGIDMNKTEQRLVTAIKAGEPVSAGQLSPGQRKSFDQSQVKMSQAQREETLAAKRAAANRIGGARRGAVSADTLALMAGVGSAVAGGMAAAAPAAVETMPGLLTPPPNRTRQQMEKMTNSDAGLGFNVTPEGELEGDPAGLKAVRDRQKKGVSFPTYYPQVNENNMMNQWLKAQTQKQQPSTRSMELQRQGMPITEQLNAKEEKFAKEHKHMLANMIKKYGQEKGTRVFYATVREKVKKLHENCASIDSSPIADALRKKIAAQELKQKSTIKLNKKEEDEGTEEGTY